MTRAVGVVIPAYRPDVARLAAYVDALLARLDPLVVRVELDAPGDDVLERLASLPDRVTVNAVDARRGKGAAVTAGFEALAVDTDAEVFVFCDADGSTPPGSVADVAAPVVDGEVDLSVGSRRHPDATVASHQTFARRYLGDGFAWLARRLLDVSLYDYQCGAKALTADAWTAVRSHLYEPGFAWDIELVAVADALGYRLAEVPVVWEDQPGSTVDPIETSLRLARGLLVSRHRARSLRDDHFHSYIETLRRSTPALVDRPGVAVPTERER